MFTTPNIQAALKGITLRVEETDDETRRVADCKFLVQPFSVALARELDPAVVQHCFELEDETAGEAGWVPRPEIADVLFAIGIPLQRLAVRRAPDEAQPATVLPVVGIRKVRVLRPKPDKPTLGASFVASFDVDGQMDELGILIRLWGRWTYLTFEPLQRRLPLAPGVVRAVRDLASAVGTHNGRCPECRADVPATATVCPHCAADLKPAISSVTLTQTRDGKPLGEPVTIDAEAATRIRKSADRILTGSGKQARA